MTRWAALLAILLGVLIILLIVWLVRWKKEKKKYEEEETPNEIRYEQQQQLCSRAQRNHVLINSTNDSVGKALLIFDVHVCPYNECDKV